MEAEASDGRPAGWSGVEYVNLFAVCGEDGMLDVRCGEKAQDHGLDAIGPHIERLKFPGRPDR